MPLVIMHKTGRVISVEGIDAFCAKCLCLPVHVSEAFMLFVPTVYACQYMYLNHSCFLCQMFMLANTYI